MHQLANFVLGRVAREPALSLGLPRDQVVGEFALRTWISPEKHILGAGCIWLIWMEWKFWANPLLSASLVPHHLPHGVSKWGSPPGQFLQHGPQQQDKYLPAGMHQGRGTGWVTDWHPLHLTSVLPPRPPLTLTPIPTRSIQAHLSLNAAEHICTPPGIISSILSNMCWNISFDNDSSLILCLGGSLSFLFSRL